MVRRCRENITKRKGLHKFKDILYAWISYIDYSLVMINVVAERPMAFTDQETQASDLS